MGVLLLWIGRLAGLSGVLLTVVAFGSRAAGNFFLGGFQVGTILQAGIAAMLLGCLSYMANLAERPRKPEHLRLSHPLASSDDAAV